jgi:hypothetical protein
MSGRAVKAEMQRAVVTERTSLTSVRWKNPPRSSGHQKAKAAREEI